MLLAPLVLLLAAAPARAADGPPAALKHRLYVGPEEIRALDSRTLAERVVARLHDECDLAGAPASTETVLGGDAALVLMLPVSVLDAVARGGFLNQYQTRTTGGFHRERDRFEAEQELAMLRLPFSASGFELLPKYAVLDVRKEGLGTFRLPTQYGGAAVVFKPEVAARATWTYADSLDYSRKTGRFDSGGAANPVLPKTFLYRRKPEDLNSCGNYCEGQIWGKLTLGDAAYVMLRSTELVPEALARAGVPVYDYSVPDSTSAVVDATRTAQYVRGALRVLPPPPPPPRPVKPKRGQRSRHRHGPAAEAPDQPPSDAALVDAVENASSKPDSEGGFSPRQRLVGELASRPKSEAVVRELEKVFSSDDAQTKAFALYGLSELPWEQFKPLLLESLHTASRTLLIPAVAFAAEHRDDAEVAARLNELKSFPDPDVSEWLGRLDARTLCAPR
jgi:hypothetical protein